MWPCSWEVAGNWGSKAALVDSLGSSEKANADEQSSTPARLLLHALVSACLARLSIRPVSHIVTLLLHGRVTQKACTHHPDLQRHAARSRM